MRNGGLKISLAVSILYDFIASPEAEEYTSTLMKPVFP
jgi:hypothetical protein